jgi:CBS domain-containing protein
LQEVPSIYYQGKGLAMKVQEIMTRDVISVRPETPIRDVAALLAKRRISGVPVTTDDDKMLGIVSEGDLLRRPEIGTEPKGNWWLEGFAQADAIASTYAKAHGLKAGDVMTRHVASVHPSADLVEAAAVLDSHHIKRVPVVHEGKLIGIVTRSDIVRALSRSRTMQPGQALDDGTLQKAILEKMRVQFWLDTSFVNLTVRNGIVALGGFVATAEQRRALCVLIAEIAGVLDVEDNLEIGLPIVREFS